MNNRIFICAGHGGSDVGAVACDKKTTEHYLAKRVVDAAIPVITAAGVDCLTVSGKTLPEKTEYANRSLIDMAVEIHFNACRPEDYGRGSGFCVLHYPRSVYGQQIAGCILAGLEEYLPFRPTAGGLVKRSDLYFLRQCVAPAVIIELLFLDNPVDFSFLSCPRAYQIIATALRKGILDWYKIP